MITGHNIRGFDLPRINSSFLVHGYPPPSCYQTIDTLQTARRKFNFSSNKMDFLNQKLEIADKIETNFELWKRCLKGDNEAKKALAEMDAYCKHDVTCTEELYLTLRPWVPSHINVGTLMEGDDSVCSACGSNNIQENGFYYTPAGKYQSYRCGNCGALSRARTSSYEKSKRKELLRSVAR